MALSLNCYKFLRLSSVTRHLSRYLSNTTSERKGLLLGVYSNENNVVELTASAEQYNNKTQGKLLEHIKLVGNEVKAGKSFIFWGIDKEFPAVAVVGLGKKNEEIEDLELITHENESVRVATSAGCKALDAAGVKNIFVEDFGNPESAAEGSILGTWKFQEYKTKKDILPKVQLYDPNESKLSKWLQGSIKAESQNLARKLADTPSNLLTPTIFSNEIQNMLSPLGLTIEVHEQEWAEKQRMNSFLCVARGSKEPPKFVEINYNKGDPNTKPYILIGKGVTFDSGGISLKPAASMDEMRADMGGAAACVAALYGLSRLNVEANIKVLIPMVENMPSGSATKPGDIITARNGKSICVNNTDAEGRLILADALCYSCEFNPKWVLDVATLTGAMAVALSDGATGVFSNSNELYRILEDAGSQTGDRVWRMPLWKHYTKKVAENTAFDLNNISKGKGGGSCTAAAFLREFIPQSCKWLHLDIAGVMGAQDDTPYLSKGMTGRPTRTLIEFIKSQTNGR